MGFELYFCARFWHLIATQRTRRCSNSIFPVKKKKALGKVKTYYHRKEVEA
jgi:hypothetical protein